MYELISVGPKTFYMDCPAKVGFYMTGENTVVIIDSGSDKDAAKKVKKILEDQNWTLEAIYDTHSHADHIGGNQYLQNLTGCKIYAPGADLAVTQFPVLEPTMLYGGFAMKELHNKFLMAKGSQAELLTPEKLPQGLEMISLPGHSYDMVGFRTEDDVIFLADALSSEETLEKYKVGFLYDVKAYLETLEKLKEIKAKVFVPAHVPQMEDIGELIQINIEKTVEIGEEILNILKNPCTFEELLSKLFAHYGLLMNLQQRMLVGSTIKSFLSYLSDEGKAEYYFENNFMYWKTK